jgi:hypothetical protein
VEAVFIDVGTDRRDLGDLVSQRVGFVSLQRGATAFAVRRLDLEGLTELLRRDQLSEVAFMSRLAPSVPPRRRGRRSPLGLDGGGIGRGRFRGVGGVEVEPLLQLGDPLLQGRDNGQDGRLGFRSYGVPERFRDRGVRAHTTETTSLLYKVFEPVNGYIHYIPYSG